MGQNGKRGAFIDELTDAQVKFLFHAEMEREKLKQKEANKNKGPQSMR